MGTFGNLGTLTLREGLFGKDLSSHMEDSPLPASSEVTQSNGTTTSSGHPQDYGGSVADPWLVEVVDKALGKG